MLPRFHAAPVGRRVGVHAVRIGRSGASPAINRLERQGEEAFMRYDDMSTAQRLEYAAQLMQHLAASPDRPRVLVDKVDEINCLAFALLYSIKHDLIGTLNVEDAVRSYAAVLVLLGYDAGREEERIDRSIQNMIEPEQHEEE
jgi:hypothetical protein